MADTGAGSALGQANAYALAGSSGTASGISTVQSYSGSSGSVLVSAPIVTALSGSSGQSQTDSASTNFDFVRGLYDVSSAASQQTSAYSGSISSANGVATASSITADIASFVGTVVSDPVILQTTSQIQTVIFDFTTDTYFENQIAAVSGYSGSSASASGTSSASVYSGSTGSVTISEKSLSFDIVDDSYDISSNPVSAYGYSGSFGESDAIGVAQASVGLQGIVTCASTANASVGASGIVKTTPIVTGTIIASATTHGIANAYTTNSDIAIDFTGNTYYLTDIISYNQGTAGCIAATTGVGVGSGSFTATSFQTGTVFVVVNVNAIGRLIDIDKYKQYYTQFIKNQKSFNITVSK